MRTTRTPVSHSLWRLTVLASAMYSVHSHAVETTTITIQPQPSSPQACIGLTSNSDRLACFDAFFSPPPETIIDAAPVNVIDQNLRSISPTDEPEKNLTEQIKQTATELSLFGTAPAFNPSSSLLDQRWELSEQSKLGTWQIRAYQPIYVLPVMWTSDKNPMPSSPNPLNTVTTPQDLKSTEAKFQLSLKTKAIEGVFADGSGDLWIGYTQSSRWQVYNEDESRPFRETNYEPEASLIFRTNYNFLGLHGRLLGFTFNHQSNGRSDPFSRSWNRVMLNLGFEKDNFAMMLRPWYRLEEDREEDNNPDIKNYIGRGDLTANYKWKDHNFSLMLRHSLKGGKDNHGAVQFDWAFPLSGSLRGHLQLFDGYGESLIDYNHHATYVGLGISLINWF